MKFGRFLPTTTTLGLALLVLNPAASGTSVSAPGFDQMVGQSDYIVRAVVQSVTSEWRDNPDQPGQRYIGSLVTLDVKEVIKGTPPSPLVLDVVGGRVGDKTLTIGGAPKFVVGEESILFVKGNGRQIIPLVGMMHGMYPVKHDKAGGKDQMARSNGRLLYSEKEIGSTDSPPAVAAAPDPAARPLSPAEFAARIRKSPKYIAP